MPVGFFAKVKNYEKNKVKKTIPCSSYFKRLAGTNNPPKKEFEISKLMGNENIGPKVYSSSIKMFTSEMILNKMNNTFASKQNITKTDMKDILTLIVRMHRLGYDHFDIHGNNIMYKTSKNGKVQWRLIDFGRSAKICSKFIDIDYKNTIKFITTEECVHFYGMEKDISDLAKIFVFKYLKKEQEKDKLNFNIHRSRYKFYLFFVKLLRKINENTK